MTKNVFGQETRPVEISNWPIHRFYHLVEDGILDLNPPYQRGLVWDLEHKVKLIDSLVSGLGIPAVYLREKRDGYEVIDGKQRIHTICSFLNDGFPYNGKIYSKHDEDSRLYFTFITTVGVTILKDISDEEALEIYNRINFYGVPHEHKTCKLPPGNYRKE